MIKIYNKKISFKSSPFVIAEIGINHNGSINKAFKLIDFAVAAKCDAVKFQTININNLMVKNTPLAKYQKKTKFKSMNELIDKYNLEYSDFIKLKNYCKKKRIIFLSTPFDIDSAIFLNKINVPAFKISSTDNDNIFLIETIKKFNKPVILSTGMTNINELKNILDLIKFKKNKLAILHCISDYPTKIRDSKLGAIDQIKKFGYQTGFSDHTKGSSAAIASIAKGATIIEKHITLDNNMEGPDHKASLECKKLSKFVKDIRDIKISLLDNKNSISKKENVTKKIAKKSIYFSKNLKKNHKIKKNDLIALRPRLNGVSPINYKKIIGKTLKNNVKTNSIFYYKKIK